MIQNQKFIDLLKKEKILTDNDANQLLIKHKKDAFAILQYLKNGNVAKKDSLGKLWGDSLEVAFVNLDKTFFQNNVIKYMPENFARKNHMIPLYQIGDTITVATTFPNDKTLVMNAQQIMGKTVSPVFTFAEDIDDAIEIQYQSGDNVTKFINKIAENEMFKGTSKITEEQLKNFSKHNNAIIEFTRSILLLSLKEHASDIHIEPQEDIVRIRFRIDGVLQARLKLDKELINPLISRFKVMSNLDITEKRKPQDGRITLALSNRSIDFRVSTIPTIYGEKIVMRILGQIKKDEIPDLLELNFSHSNYATLKKVIDTPNGVFFVTGPTGSGKSTTLFSVLQHLNKPDINIMTIEDPVEYRLAGVNQVQVNQKINLNFATALRSFLRQDPDIVLIGEIRDLETAKIASQAALTGHLVLATMHTNDALQAVTRLVEIGVEPFLVAPSIIGVMAQRLVRKICDNCKESYNPSEKEINKYFIWDKKTQVKFFKGKGCDQCNHIGYKGRIAIHEMFIMNEEIRSMVAKGASILDIRQVAYRTGFKNLRYDGLKKVLRGLITIEELERVTAAQDQ